MSYTLAAFYRFTPIRDPAALRETLLADLAPFDLVGSLLIAPEGINGTLAGGREAIDALLDQLHRHTGLPRDAVKFAPSSAPPFRRFKIRLKRELIPFGQPQADPLTLAGTYVAPKDWNALIAQPDVVVLDTRNVYEVGIGTFAGAIDPKINRFTEFAAYVREQMDPARDKKIAMFCTGGIRCEKASAFMRAEGFQDVFHLQGGILKYLEEVPPENSLWNGDCYVFDQRVAVGHGLETGRYGSCEACGAPVSGADRSDPRYEAGVACPHCHDRRSDSGKARFRQRKAQRT